MAVAPPVLRERFAPAPPRERPTTPPVLPLPADRLPELTARTHFWERAGNAAPLIASVAIIAAIFLAPWHPVTAALLAVGLTTFFLYWMLRSYSVAIACVIGLRRLRRWAATDWRARYARWHVWHRGAEPWTWPRHMVIIPNYREDEDELARTLDSLAGQANADQLVVVLAMEARESGAAAKAERLIARYGDGFNHCFFTLHPADLPMDTPGKGSNEAWAARQAYLRLIATEGLDLSRFTVTSCDADAVFHPLHFSALNYLFLTSQNRYRTFWQPAIFNSNNIWDVPAPLRIPEGLSGINRLSNLVLPWSIDFPTSCYSTTWAMLHTVDYWDEEIIPEDWHIYMKCSYALGDEVRVEPIYLPLGNDGVMAGTARQTFAAHYTQAVRHAWGASDIPYAWRAASRGPASFWRRVLLASAVTKVHVFWASQWFLVTLGVLIPARFAALGAPMPHWWTHKAFHVPGLGWHPENMVSPEAWMTIGHTGVVEPSVWLNLSGLLVALCLFPLLVIIVVELRTRGPKPAGKGNLLFQLAMWPLLAVITFIWTTVPALHAQWRLAAGRGLVYRVAEKSARSSTGGALPAIGGPVVSTD